MTKFNPFRVSFDRPLGEGERKRARVAATVVSATALVLGVTSVSALLNASSDTVAAWTNAAPEPEIRMLAREGEDTAGKSCDDQTWPYIEQRCLKPAAAKAAQRSTPKHGFAAQPVVLPGAPLPPITQPPAAAPETTGAASSSDDRPPMTTAKRSPQPMPQQAVVAPGPAGPALGADAAAQRLDADPRRSPREARSLQREERKQLQRERRDEAKRAREEQAKARAEARDARRHRGGDRIVRRWSEYTYQSPNGGNQRVIVIRRGSLDDDFFRTVR